MCLPNCQQTILANLSRRFLFRTTLAATAATLFSSCGERSKPNDETSAQLPHRFPGFSRVMDLTHNLTPDFPTYSGKSQFQMQSLATYIPNGYQSFSWVL